MAYPLSDPNELIPSNTISYLIYAVFLLVLVLWVVHQRHRESMLWRYGNKLPGPRALPILGNVLMAIGKNPDEFAKLAYLYRSLYGNVARGWIGHKLVVFLADAKDVEVILNSHVHINKAAEYQLFRPWLGDGLLISSGSVTTFYFKHPTAGIQVYSRRVIRPYSIALAKCGLVDSHMPLNFFSGHNYAGEKWKTHRKIIAPTFHINILKSFMDVFNENSKQVIEKMRAESGKVFDVHDYMSEATVDILLETAMGTTKESHGGSGYDYAMAVMKMCDILHQRHYKFWLRPDFLFKLSSLFSLQNKLLNTIHGLTNKVIQIKKKAYLDNKSKGITNKTLGDLMQSPSTKTQDVEYGDAFSDSVFNGLKDDLDYNDDNDIGVKKRLAFLDLMLESARNGTANINDQDIKEEVDTIMFEGHDTTASGSSFVLCLLGVHQDIQAKVHNELYEIFGDSDRPATFFDTLHMKYLERVILETLRLYSPVPIIARELTEDVKIVTNDYLLPAGATVVISPIGVHRNPRYYKDPEVFNPDNFLPENAAARHYYSFIPFSAGPRSCVGRKYAFLKLKVLLSAILRESRVISDVLEEDFILKGDIILKRADGFKIRLEPRK